MMFYGSARLLIDSMRSDLRIGGVNVNQVIGGLFAIAFLTVFIIRRIRLKKLSEESVPYQPSQYREILDTVEQEPSESPSPVPDESAQGEENPETAPGGAEIFEAGPENEKKPETAPGGAEIFEAGPDNDKKSETAPDDADNPKH
jgi:hypothetical protein